MEWFNLYIVYRLLSINLRLKLFGIVESFLLLVSDNEDNFSVEVVDEFGVIIMVSIINDFIEIESFEFEEVNESNRVNGEIIG